MRVEECIKYSTSPPPYKTYSNPDHSPPKQNTHHIPSLCVSQNNWAHSTLRPAICFFFYNRSTPNYIHKITTMSELLIRPSLPLQRIIHKIKTLQQYLYSMLAKGRKNIIHKICTTTPIFVFFTFHSNLSFKVQHPIHSSKTFASAGHYASSHIMVIFFLSVFVLLIL